MENTHKKRKLSDDNEDNMCNICFLDNIPIVKCFNGCSINTCKDCIKQQLYTTKRVTGSYCYNMSNFLRISYKCSQCRVKCKYIPQSNYIDTNQTSWSVEFSQFVVSNPDVMEFIINKICNIHGKTTSEIDEDENIISDTESEDTYIENSGYEPIPLQRSESIVPDFTEETYTMPTNTQDETSSIFQNDRAILIENGGYRFILRPPINNE